MQVQTTWRLKPEGEEILRQRAELAEIQSILAERELDLVDLKSQLAAFEGRYLRQVGLLYSELDEWTARISELQARLYSSADADTNAYQAHEQARQTYEDAHAAASEAHDFIPSPELRSLYRDVAKRIHPDFGRDDNDVECRTRLMAQANRAYEAGDAEALHHILDEYHDGADGVEGEGIGAELIRVIRQISQARARLSAIEEELVLLLQSEIAKLKQDAEDVEKQGRDLLAELAVAIQERIQQATKEYETVARRLSQ
jgi:hypothetical protein